MKTSHRPSLRLCVFAGVILLAACFSPVSFVHSQRELSGLAELKKGDYDNAFKLLSARLVSNPTDAVAQRALLRVFIETGRYLEAEATAKSGKLAKQNVDYIAEASAGGKK